MMEHSIGLSRKSISGLISNAFQPSVIEDPYSDSVSITDTHRLVLQQVPHQYFADVFAFLAENPEAADEAADLMEIVWAEKKRHQVEIGEIVVGSDIDQNPRLVMYLRITEPRDRFEEIKERIRSEFEGCERSSRQLVFPLILRRVKDV